MKRPTMSFSIKPRMMRMHHNKAVEAVSGMKYLGYAIVLELMFLTACRPRPHNVTEVDALPDIYPDYVDVTVPAEIAPLNFAMADDSVSRVEVEVKGAKGGCITVNGRLAQFSIGQWHRLLAGNRGSHLLVTVMALKDGQWIRYRTFKVFVSNDPLSDWGVTYRRVSPGYGMFSQMGLYQRELSTFDEKALLPNTQVSGMCVNCHTPNRANPDQYTFHVRGRHGATVISRNGQIDLLAARNDSLGGSMVYPCWHPGGRYCAYSTNATSQMFHLAQNKRIEVFDRSSDIFIYDAETRTVLRDSLTMAAGWAENCPAFSPDGKWLYYVSSPCQPYPEGYDREKYSLCRVAFDAETGRLGQQADTLINAAQTGQSVSWPRLSYDGRYLMYTQADYGYFTIWHPEADLWLMDLETGRRRKMDEVNSPRAESLHAWSTDSRWFLFTSRREDGLYTLLYFSSIGPDGKATKPFLLPQRNPRQYYRQSLFSFNTPDFTVRPVKTNLRHMGQLIESDRRAATGVVDLSTTTDK